MQEVDFSCAECQRPLLDLEDEFACPSCGIVREKEAVVPPGQGAQVDFRSARFLGSYMGTLRGTREERRSKGISGSGSRYRYIKTVSDFAGRPDGAAESCERLIQRVGEKLSLPAIAMEEASSVARGLLTVGLRPKRGIVPTVSAFSLISACKIEEVTTASVREIVAAFESMGRTVSGSWMNRLAMESPVRTAARTPEDYLGRVLAKLSMNKALAENLSRLGTAQTPYLNSLREVALQLLAKVEKVETAGRRPCALAASAIYSAELVLSLRQKRKKLFTQRVAAECTDSAEYTIREQCATVFARAVKEATARCQSDLPPPAPW